MKRYFLILTIAAGLFACDKDSVQQKARVALLRVDQLTDSTYSIEPVQVGEAIFNAYEDRVVATISVSGLIPNWSHALHLHHGTCTQPRHHWNQMGTVSFCNTENMGDPWYKPKAGDIGNVETDENGNGTFTIQSEFWDINSRDEKDILGMVLIVHENPEDFEAECFEQHTHKHNNRKIACGTLDLAVND